MKKIFLLVIIVVTFTGCDNQADKKTELNNDLAREGLNGDVRSIKAIKYEAIESADGKLICGNSMYDLVNSVVNYDEKGMKTSIEILDSTENKISLMTITYDPNGKLAGKKYESKSGHTQEWKYIYSADGKIEREELIIGTLEPMITKYIYTDGRLIRKDLDGTISEYNYDEAGNLINIKETINDHLTATIHYLYTPKGEFEGREEMRHESNATDFTTRKFDARDRLMQVASSEKTENYSYNEKGDLIEKITPTHKIRYEYKYDKAGNWIEQLQISECTSLESCSKCGTDKNCCGDSQKGTGKGGDNNCGSGQHKCEKGGSGESDHKKHETDQRNCVDEQHKCGTGCGKPSESDPDAKNYIIKRTIEYR